MRNATISTSRTRADSRPPITYRPLDPSLGDVEHLRAVRAARAASFDPSTATVTIDLTRDEPGAPTSSTTRRHRTERSGGLLGRLFGTSGGHRGGTGSHHGPRGLRTA